MKIIIVVIVLIAGNQGFSQTFNYSEVLTNTENVQEAFLNKSSILVRTSSTNFRLFNLDENKEQEINLYNHTNNISLGDNDVYFIPTTGDESNNYGIIMDKNGIKDKVRLSTSNAKISKNGKYILTTKDDVFGGKFQLFDAMTLQEYSVPKRIYSTFVADFIDTARVFVLYQYRKSIPDKFDKRRAIIKSLKEKVRNNKISKDELHLKLKKLPKRPRGKPRIKKQYMRITKCFVYNIVKQKIEWETELITNGIKHNFYPNNSLSISRDGQNILMTAYSQDKNNLKRNNKILAINLRNRNIVDLTQKIVQLNNARILKIFYMGNNDVFVSILNNRKVEYHVLSNNFQYSIVSKSSDLKAHMIKYVEKNNDIISIVSEESKLFEWNFKKNIQPKRNNKPVIYYDNKILKVDNMK